MTNPYGPWATAIDTGQNPQLSSFWRQRLTMLVPTSQTSPVLSRRKLLGLLAMAVLIGVLPTLHAVPSVAQQEKESREKGKDQVPDANNHARFPSAVATSSSTGEPKAVQAKTIAEIEEFGGKAGVAVVSVDLAFSKINDAGLAYIEALTELRSLSVSGTQITDAGLVHIKMLRQLRKLILNDTKVTDAGLANLMGLAELEELHLIGTRVTDAGVKAVHRALPKCRIFRERPATVDPSQSKSPRGTPIARSEEKEKPDGEQFVTRSYDLHGLIEADAAQPLQDLCESVIAPASWQSNGGEATLSALGTVLTVRQTPSAHANIAALLQALRKLGRTKGEAEMSLFVGAQRQGATEMQIVVYSVGELIARKDLKVSLVDHLTETVAPASWVDNGGEGSIRVYPLPAALIVSNTPEVQKEIGGTLSQLRQGSKR